MEKVKVSIKGGGSFKVHWDEETKTLRSFIIAILAERNVASEEIKRGPKKRLVIADEGSEGNNHD